MIARALNTTHLMLIIHVLYTYTVLRFGHLYDYKVWCVSSALRVYLVLSLCSCSA